MLSLVTSIFLYACESWTLTAELQRRIQSKEMRCYRKILHILYKDHVTNRGVCANIQQAVRLHKDLLTIIKRHKMKWYGHVSCSSALAKTILQGTVKGGRRQADRKRKNKKVRRQHLGMDRPGVRQVPEGSEERRKMEETGCEVICDAPTTSVAQG